MPPRSPSTARSSRCRTTSGTPCGLRSSTESRRGIAFPGPTASRPICSPVSPDPMDVGRAEGLTGAALLVAVAIGGVVVGVCAAWVSRAVWRSGGGSVPWGLLVSLAGSLSFVVLTRQLRRAAPVVAAVSWFAGVVVVLVRGDTVVAGDGLGIAFLLIVTGSVMIAATVGGARR